MAESHNPTAWACTRQMKGSQGTLSDPLETYRGGGGARRHTTRLASPLVQKRGGGGVPFSPTLHLTTRFEVISSDVH